MKFKVIEKKLLIDDYFQVEKARVKFDQHFANEPVEVSRFNLLRGIAVTSLVYHLEKKAVILVRQFRYSTAEAGFPWLLELPAGLAEDNEEPMAAAMRENLEETGYQIHNLKEINRFFVAPGCTDEQIILFYGEVTEIDKIEPGGGAEGENEDIKLFYLPVAEIPHYLKDVIVDAKTIIGLNWFWQQHFDRK